MSKKPFKPSPIRPDLRLIIDLVNPGSRVLDIGCGNGELLAHLATHKQVDGRGIEISISGVREALSHGLSVIQGDADEDLKHYPDKAFDYAILSHTIQATENPRKVLEQMVRIANLAIVSIPNFGYWRNRLHLMLEGRMPVTKHLPYQWYETPNIHFCTIRDFVTLCNDMELVILKKFAARGLQFAPSELRAANFLAEQAVFLVHGQ